MFFECIQEADRLLHLERLLSLAWNVDTTAWTEDGLIYNVTSAEDLLMDALGPDASSDCRLFETGAGGIGKHRIQYARSRDLDIFVSRAVAERLRLLSEQIERW